MRHKDDVVGGNGVQLVVATEARMRLSEDGTVVSPDGTRAYGFWKRYVEGFERVSVLARVAATRGPGMPVEGPGVSVVQLPDFAGSIGYLWKRREITSRSRAAIEEADAVLVRSPGLISGLAERVASGSGCTLAVEVVGDPWDVFAPGVTGHPLRPLVRRYMTRQLARQCGKASAISYVTKETLQRRYPPNPTALTCHYSSVDLPEDAFKEPGADTYGSGRPLRVICVGSLNRMYKGPDVLLEAVAIVAAEDLSVSVRWLGDGRFRERMEQRAARMGLETQVSFPGAVPSGESVWTQLDWADLFVMPSRTEGLPRALIEAMARGLPCIASDVGGIPELLNEEALVPSGDAAELAARIIDFSQDIEQRQRQAQQNFSRAQGYARLVLDARRTAFYKGIRDISGR